MSFFTKRSLGKSSFFQDDLPEEAIQEEYEELLDVSEPVSQEPEEELSVDVYNTPSAIMIVAQVAGCSDEDVNLSVQDDVLVLEATYTLPEHEELAAEFAHTVELTWGRRSRPIILPKTADISKIKAKITKERVLIVTVPKANVTQEHVITIETD